MNAQYQWQEIVPFKLENVNFMIYPEKRVLRTLREKFQLPFRSERQRRRD